MKKLFQKILQKVFKKVVNKAVSDNSGEMPEVESVSILDDNSKKNFWKFILQTAINILAAVLTALGASSCVSHF